MKATSWELICIAAQRQNKKYKHREGQNFPKLYPDSFFSNKRNCEFQIYLFLILSIMSFWKFQLDFFQVTIYENLPFVRLFYTAVFVNLTWHGFFFLFPTFEDPNFGYPFYKSEIKNELFFSPINLSTPALYALLISLHCFCYWTHGTLIVLNITSHNTKNLWKHLGLVLIRIVVQYL